MKAPTYILTELGREKRCPHCGEYWPADREFFWPRLSGPKAGLLRPWCHACEEEYKRARKLEVMAV
mgnify:CR=1 FL=1